MKALEIVREMNKSDYVILDYEENYNLVQMFDYDSDEFIDCMEKLDKIAVDKKLGEGYILYIFKDGKIEFNFE